MTISLFGSYEVKVILEKFEVFENEYGLPRIPQTLHCLNEHAAFVLNIGRNLCSPSNPFDREQHLSSRLTFLFNLYNNFIFYFSISSSLLTGLQDMDKLRNYATT